MTNPTPVILSLQAMATRFELVLYGDDPVRLRAAGEEALNTIAQLDAQLSFYRADSELRWIAAHAAAGPVKVEPRLFRLLQRCAFLTDRTDGAFDITVGPLMRTWKFVGDTGRKPEPAALAAARSVVGMRQVGFDENAFTITFERPGMELDLGAVGKGYAIERAVALLREHGIRQALLHGGTSTVYAIGRPPDGAAWRVAVQNPLRKEEALCVVDLVDRALSVSAPHGKSFLADGREYGHVIDPRTAEPIHGTLTVAIVSPSPTDSDALSTALLVWGESGLSILADRFPGYAGLIGAAGPDAGIRVITSGL